MWRFVRGQMASFLPTQTSDSYQLLAANETADAHALNEPGRKEPSLTTTLKGYGFFLLPSFVQHRLRPVKAAKLYPTSYLDGLRGVASFLVFICHFTQGNVPALMETYGLPVDNTSGSAPVQLPFLRVLFSGRPMVHIFFVISGFVLSYKPIKLIRAHNYLALHETLASSVFRRALRLFLPTTCSTFMVMILIRLGAIQGAMPTFTGQLWDWGRAVWQITFSWRWDITQFVPYDPHLWTIPIEMSMSMLLFITIIGLSRCKVWIRLSMLVGLMMYGLKCQHWACFEFLGGMLLAEIGMIQTARAARDANKEGRPPPDQFPFPSRIWQVFFTLNFVIALWVSGWPNDRVAETPGLRYLAAHTMDPYFTTGGDLVSFPWYALASIQVVTACQEVPWIQNMFTTGFAQYLANISYALYLMHGPILDVLAYRVMPTVWWMVGGNASMWSRQFAWLFGLLIMGPPIIWAADVFWRAVDIPSVKFAKWLEGACIVKED